MPGVSAANCSKNRIISLFRRRGPPGACIRARSPRMRIWRYATILSRALSNDLLFDFLSTPVWKRNGCCAARGFSEGCRPSAALACRGGGRVVAGRIRTGPMLGCGDSAHVRRLRPEAIRLPRRDRGAGRGPGGGRSPILVFLPGFDGYSSTFREPPSRPRPGNALTCGNVGGRPRPTRGFAKSVRITEKACRDWSS